jgi:hypothetical protein
MVFRPFQYRALVRENIAAGAASKQQLRIPPLPADPPASFDHSPFY